MPDFLSMLKQSQTFPLGRPDTGGGLSEITRQVVPLVNNMKDRDAQRRREMMQFEASLANKQHMIANQKPVQYLNPDTPTSGRMNSAPAVVGGPGNFSPMQRLFQARDQDDRNFNQRSTLQDNQNTSRYNQAMDEVRLRSQGEMERTAADINARRGMNVEDNASREKIAADALAARKGETAEERAFRIQQAQIQATNERNNITARGIQDRLTNSTRPATLDDQYNQQVQDFRINFPNYAKNITYDEKSKQWGIDPSGLTPQQLQEIKTRMAVKRPPSRSGNTGVNGGR